MNKAELIERLAEVTGKEKNTIAKIVTLTFEAISEHLKAGGEVQIVGFGTFAARWRKARVGIDIRDYSKQVQMRAVRVPRFKAGTKLKDLLKNTELTPPNP